jgi:carbamate kinase
MLALIAVGGNSLIRAGQRGTIDEQRANAAMTARAVAQLVRTGYAAVVTHGNGPQVGAQLLRSELAAGQVIPEPLDVCGADTQGAIGYVLEQAIEQALADAGLAASVCTIVTQVVVDGHDPAFRRPSKPVGLFYSADEAQRHERERGWVMVEDAARGWRRVVPSPEPLEIVEIEAIRSLVRAGCLVIAAGGGGIPVVRRAGQLVGVEAVIDKDRASALLAIQLGAELLVISTDTDYVYVNYRRPAQRPLRQVSAAALARYQRWGHFPPGSMGPKVEAALRFLRAGGREVIVTSPERLVDAVLCGAGTHIVPSARPHAAARRAQALR